MGIIGRLDDQVEEVIINPIGERNRQENSDRQTLPVTPTELPQAEERVDNAEEKTVENGRSIDLPVWLL